MSVRLVVAPHPDDEALAQTRGVACECDAAEASVILKETVK